MPVLWLLIVPFLPCVMWGQRDAVNTAACTTRIHDGNEHTCIYGWVNSLVFSLHSCTVGMVHCHGAGMCLGNALHNQL